MNHNRYDIDGLLPSVGVYEPDDVSDLQGFMSERNMAGETVSIIGGGTRLQFGNKLESYDYAVDMSSINKVVAHNEADLTCRVQSGLKVKQLQDLLNDHGQFLAVDCPFPSEATIGGTLASNAPGFLRWQLAHMRDMVIGMQVVFAAGTLTKSGGQVVKNVSGYDMARLHVGGLGTLGIITEVSFKLTPLPAKQGSLSVNFNSRSEAYEFSRNIFNSYAMPLALSIVDVSLLEMDEIPADNVSVIVRLGGRDKAFERQVKIISDIARKFDIGNVELLDSRLSATTWNEIRDFGWLDPKIETILNVNSSPVDTKVVEDVIRKVLDSSEIKYNVVSQPGFGVLYGYLGVVSGEDNRWRRIVTEIRDKCGKVGADVRLEKVPSDEKKEIDVWPQVEPRVLKLMQDLKETYDPVGILNKGRFIGRI